MEVQRASDRLYNELNRYRKPLQEDKAERKATRKARKQKKIDGFCLYQTTLVTYAGQRLADLPSQTRNFSV